MKPKSADTFQESSIIKNDPEFEIQIKNEYEKMDLEYPAIEEFKQEFDDQQIEIKIENCTVKDEFEVHPHRDGNNSAESSPSNLDCLGKEWLKTSTAMKWSCEETYKCGYCEFKCDEIMEINNHVNNLHNSESAVSKYGSTQFLKVESRIDTASMEKHCDFEYIGLSNIKRRDVEFMNQYKCEHCDYETAELRSIKSHVISKHTKQYIFKCVQCDYQSTCHSNLKRHMFKHTGEKKYKCKHCSYESAHTSSIKYHINTKHTREKIYICEHCDYESTLLSTLKRHVKAKHTKENYKIHKCERCIYSSDQLSNLKRHMNTKHTKKIHKCDRCDYETLLIFNFKRHIQSKHME